MSAATIDRHTLVRPVGNRAVVIRAFSLAVIASFCCSCNKKTDPPDPPPSKTGDFEILVDPEEYDRAVGETVEFTVTIQSAALPDQLVTLADEPATFTLSKPDGDVWAPEFTDADFVGHTGVSYVEDDSTIVMRREVDDSPTSFDVSVRCFAEGVYWLTVAYADAETTGVLSCTPGEASCGNGMIEDGEECDGDSWGPATCGSQTGGVGTLGCNDDCTLDLSGCDTTVPSCGEVQPDGTCAIGVGDNTCEGFGFSSGDLGCDATCQLLGGGCCLDGNCDPPTLVPDRSEVEAYLNEPFTITFQITGNDVLFHGDLDGTGMGIGPDNFVPETVSFASDNRIDDNTATATYECNEAPAAVTLDPALYTNYTGLELVVARATPEVTVTCLSRVENCGDGVIQPPEECEFGDLGEKSLCEDWGYEMGGVQCVDCRYDTSGCYAGISCGNDSVEFPEHCDGDDLGERPTCEDHNLLGGSQVTCRSDCTYDTSGCAAPVCGDGVVEGDELCDGSVSVDCSDFGFLTGIVTCEDCRYDVSGCIDGCGNDRKEGLEACDGVDLGGSTCATIPGFDGGTLACSPTCDFDTDGCTESLCGNGNIDAMESCDGANLGGLDCTTIPNSTFTGGTLTCDPFTCAFDASGCTNPVADCETAGFADLFVRGAASSNGFVYTERRCSGSPCDIYLSIVDPTCAITSSPTIVNMHNGPVVEPTCHPDDGTCGLFRQDPAAAGYQHAVIDTSQPVTTIPAWADSGVGGEPARAGAIVVDVNGDPVSMSVGVSNERNIVLLDHATGMITGTWTAPALVGIAPLSSISFEPDQAVAMLDGTTLRVWLILRRYQPSDCEHWAILWEIDTSTGAITTTEQLLEAVPGEGFNHENGLALLPGGDIVVMTRQPDAPELHITQLDGTLTPSVTNVPIAGTNPMLESRFTYLPGVGHVVAGIIEDGAQRDLGVWFLGTGTPTGFSTDTPDKSAMGRRVIVGMYPGDNAVWVVSYDGTDDRLNLFGAP